jgi:hypothetical protein
MLKRVAHFIACLATEVLGLVRYRFERTRAQTCAQSREVAELLNSGVLANKVFAADAPTMVCLSFGARPVPLRSLQLGRRRKYIALLSRASHYSDCEYHI